MNRKNKTIICRVPRELAEALKKAAARELITKSAYARRAILYAVRRDLRLT